ncbi:Hypoxia up-regulated protein 1 [Blomia tropicalis]|nr:Hypoxia up-regulated protein 1 [Blomia tropicalis]
MITKEIFERVREHRERPEALSALRNILNISDMFHTNAINVSEDEQIFSQIELANLRKIIDDTQSWMEDAETEQAALPKNVNPNKLTLRAIAEKISALDREVKYLLNKARITPPKKKPIKVEEEEVKKSEEPVTEKVQTDNPEPVNEEISPDKVVEDLPPKTEL